MKNTKEQECDDGEGWDPAVWEDIGGGELFLGLGAHVGLYDVEADAQDGVGEAHSQHRGDQNQFTRESFFKKQVSLMKTWPRACQQLAMGGVVSQKISDLSLYRE